VTQWVTDKQLVAAAIASFEGDSNSSSVMRADY
jgi:hypothetical protein